MNDVKKRKTLKRRLRRFLAHVRLRVPAGLRFLLGIVLMTGGVFGFLPVLSF